MSCPVSRPGTRNYGQGMRIAFDRFMPAQFDKFQNAGLCTKDGALDRWPASAPGRATQGLGCS